MCLLIFILSLFLALNSLQSEYLSSTNFIPSTKTAGIKIRRHEDYGSNNILLQLPGDLNKRSSRYVRQHVFQSYARNALNLTNATNTSSTNTTTTKIYAINATSTSVGTSTYNSNIETTINPTSSTKGEIFTTNIYNQTAIINITTVTNGIGTTKTTYAATEISLTLAPNTTISSNTTSEVVKSRVVLLSEEAIRKKELRKRQCANIKIVLDRIKKRDQKPKI